MLIEQKKQLETLVRRVFDVRRLLAELQSYGWKLSVGQQPLEDFDTQLELLEKTLADTAALKPEKSGAHEKKLTELLDRESYLFASLIALTTAAEQTLKQERLGFFAARDEYHRPINAEVVTADTQMKAAFISLAEALRLRWKQMSRRFGFNRVIYEISRDYVTEPLLAEPVYTVPKVFANSPIRIWGAFVKNYLGVFTQVLAENEELDARLIADTLFK